MNMLAMVKDTPSIPLDRLSGSRTQLMTDLSKLVGNRGSALLMAMPCRGCFMCLSLLGKPSDEDLERYPAVHLTGPMNGILQSWTFLTHLVMGSLLGPMTPWRGLLLTLTLMNFGITPIGQPNSQYFG